MLKVAPLTACIGAEVSGVDLADDLPDSVIEEIREILLEWKVVFFRDQHRLDRLYRQSTIVDLQCRFRWQPGSVAFWDNRATQHTVSNDFLPARRVMERVTVAGDKPF